MKRIIMERMKRVNNREVNEDGFSLLELVVAIGILLILTVGGLIGYSQITQNAKVAATESAASDVYTAAVAFDANGDDPKDAERQWTESAGAKSNIDVVVTPGVGCLTVTATHSDGIEKKRSNCGADGSEGGNPDDNGNPGGSDNENPGGNGDGNSDDDGSGNNSGDGSGDSGESNPPVIPTGKYTYNFGGGSMGALVAHHEAVDMGWSDGAKATVKYTAGGKDLCVATPESISMDEDSQWLDGYLGCYVKSDEKYEISDISIVISVEGGETYTQKLSRTPIQDDMSGWNVWGDNEDELIVEFMA